MRACAFESYLNGGLVAELDWSEQRLTFGRPKADQIRETGATKVITSCDNCRHQITELGEHYDIPLSSVTSVSELVVNAVLAARSRDAAASRG